MRLIDADKMLQEMEEGTAPLYGYVPKDWILSEPTVSPFDYQEIDVHKVAPLVVTLLSGKWESTARDYDKSYDAPDAYKIVYPHIYKSFQYLASLISAQFIDPKEFREALLDIRWFQMKNPDTGEFFIKQPEFAALVDLAFPEWSKEARKRAVTDIDEK